MDLESLCGIRVQYQTLILGHHEVAVQVLYSIGV
jgi:hypothetical protein